MTTTMTIEKAQKAGFKYCILNRFKTLCAFNKVMLTVGKTSGENTNVLVERGDPTETLEVTRLSSFKFFWGGRARSCGGGGVGVAFSR